MSIIVVINCHIEKLLVLIIILFHMHDKKENKYLNSDFLLYLFNLFILHTIQELYNCIKKFKLLYRMQTE